MKMDLAHFWLDLCKIGMGNAYSSLRKYDWILARYSLILLLGVKTQEGNKKSYFDSMRIGLENVVIKYNSVIV